MFQYYWPMVVVILANVGYQLIAKSTPSQINPMASLIVTYGLAMVTVTILYFITSPIKNLATEYVHLNWTAFAFGIVLVLLELGFIYLYRAGWNVSTGSLIANIVLAVILIGVGILFYHEKVTMTQAAGVVLCIGGLVLINK